MRVIAAGLVGLFLWGQLSVIPVWAEQKKSLAWRTLVIDPGHGGEDQGAKGVSGLTEQKLVLDLASQLAQLVRKRLGMRVILTRNENSSLSLPERAAIANNNKADLFISLHANADLDHQAQGLAIYVLTEQSWPSFVPSASAIPGLIHWDLAQKDYWQSSLKLAQAIQAYIVNQPQIKRRGVFTAPLLTLKGAAMPAILIEVGFLSHPQEEEKLLDPEYQELLINAIFEGILQFKRYEQIKYYD